MKPGLIRTEIFLLIVVFLGCASQAIDSEPSGTVPFIFDDNRVFAQLDFVRADGTLRKVLAFVDLGTPALVLDRKLYEELQVGQGKPVILRVGHLEMKVDSSAVETDTELGVTGPDGKRTMPVEAVLSGSVLTNYELVVDYAKRTLMVAQANTLKSTGDAVPCRVNEKTGMVSITTEIDGRPYALAVDTGSAYSWVREDVAEQWTKAHPDWERGKGAVGEANMQSRTGGAQARATILRLPEIKLGSLSLKQVGALGILPEAPPIPPAPGQSKVEGNFFDWYSKKAPETVIGWLGGNVLRGFRLMIDFPRRTTYWERVSDLDPHELDQVGVTLEKQSDGYFIAGIAQKSGKPTVDTVRVADRLIQVDDVVLSSATRGAIFAVLHGKPGEVRMLVVERDGQQLTVPAKVTGF